MKRKQRIALTNLRRRANNARRRVKAPNASARRAWGTHVSGFAKMKGH